MESNCCVDFGAGTQNCRIGIRLGAGMYNIVCIHLLSMCIVWFFFMGTYFTVLQLLIRFDSGSLIDFVCISMRVVMGYCVMHRSLQTDHQGWSVATWKKG